MTKENLDEFEIDVKKVYCSDCRYFIREDYECRKGYTIAHSPLFKSKKYALCSNKNKDNNCRDFETTLIFRIIRGIFKCK